MELTEQWAFAGLNGSRAKQFFPWADVWQDPNMVSPDSLVRRAKHPTAEDRIVHYNEQLKRRKKIDQYRQCVPAGFVDLNLYCLAFYSHRAQLLFSEIFPLLEQYTYFEWMMQHDPNAPWYRDHLIHQIRVGVIGQHLLQCPYNGNVLQDLKNGKKNEALVQTIVKVLRSHIQSPPTGNPQSSGPSTIHHLAETLGLTVDDIDENIVTWAWWMASLFHDTGYVFSFLAQLAGLAGQVHSFPLPDMMEGLQGTFKAQSAEVLFHFMRTEADAYRRWLTKNKGALGQCLKENKCPKPDPTWTAASGMGPAFLVQLCTKGHAAPGALNLVYVVERLMERGSVSPKFRFAAGLAALAILRHDTDAFRTVNPIEHKDNIDAIKKMTDEHGRTKGWLVTRPIAFEDDPISFLLALCDQVQEWCRYKSGPVGGNNSGFGQVEVAWDFDKVEMELNSGDLIVTPKYKNGKKPLQSTLDHYKTEKENYFGLDGSGGWLNPEGFCTKIIFKEPVATKQAP